MPISRSLTLSSIWRAKVTHDPKDSTLNCRPVRPILRYSIVENVYKYVNEFKETIWNVLGKTGYGLVGPPVKLAEASPFRVADARCFHPNGRLLEGNEEILLFTVNFNLF